MGDPSNRRISPVYRTQLEKAGGQPLPPVVKQRLESQLGASLDDIRVHSGPQAQLMLSSVGAKAFTVDNHVVIGNSLTLESPEASRLLGHELTHVVQQRRGR